MIVGDLVAERPARARVFEQLGIDYCCGGRRTLADVCSERGLDPAAVTAMLEALDSDLDTVGANWARAPLAELCTHIVDVHHAYLRRELPRLSVLLEKCERAHAVERPVLHETRAVFERLRVELEEHLHEEERTLFPACRAGLAIDLEHFEAEHASTGATLARLSELTDGYDTSSALCNTHRAAIDALADLERDLHEHIHEENNILFQRMSAV